MSPGRRCTGSVAACANWPPPGWPPGIGPVRRVPGTGWNNGAPVIANTPIGIGGGGWAEARRCVMRPGPDAGTGPDGGHEYLRTSCGRELTVGRLALGVTRHPAARVFVGLGGVPGAAKTPGGQASRWLRRGSSPGRCWPRRPPPNGMPGTCGGCGPAARSVLVAEVETRGPGTACRHLGGPGGDAGYRRACGFASPVLSARGGAASHGGHASARTAGLGNPCFRAADCS